MTKLAAYPPGPEAQGVIGSIPGVRFTHGVAIGVDGAEPVGPEAAGAVLVLHTALDTEEKAAQFWNSGAKVVKAASESPGFIRFIGFGEGLSTYGIGFWKTREDAAAFAKSLPHTDAMTELRDTGNQYGHYAALFDAVHPRKRPIYCDSCGHRNTVPAERCEKCQNELADLFKVEKEGTASTAP